MPLFNVLPLLFVFLCQFCLINAVIAATKEGDMLMNETSSVDEFLIGGDISALGKIEECGGVFRDKGAPGDAIEIMRNHGHNCFRLRLFVNPTYRNVVVNDLPYTIALGRRIKASGARLLLNFHYSDTWADPGHQIKPAEWAELDFDSLVDTLYQYTRDCIKTFRDEGVVPDQVQIGNEITPGFLWPDGKLLGVGDTEEQWRKFSRLLKAGVKGVKDAAGEAPVQIMLHIDGGGNWLRTKWFFENVEERQVPYDIIGLSYYPWWHGTMDDLRENLENCAATFDKDIFVVETAYPYRSMEFRNVKDLEARMLWPMTPEGQRDFLKELIHTVQGTPNNRGMGVLWWYPESIPVQNLHVWNGGATGLFDQNGNALPAMDSHSD